MSHSANRTHQTDNLQNRDVASQDFELDPSMPWGRFNFRKANWPSYGIADFDMLDNDRKLLLCMAVYYVSFDFDPLFKRDDRYRAIEGCDLIDALKLLRPLKQSSLRGAILRRHRPEGGWAASFKSVLDRIDGRAGMVLRIPCIPLNSGINSELCYSHGEGSWLWYEEDAEVFGMLAERGAVFRIQMPGIMYTRFLDERDDRSLQRAFFHLSGPVRDIFLKTRRWSLDDLDLKKISVRKELLASWNADAYRWLRDNRPETIKGIKAKDVEGTLLYDAFYEGKDRPAPKPKTQDVVADSTKWNNKTAKSFADLLAKHDFDSAERMLGNIGTGFPGGRWDIDIWVNCAKNLDRELFDFLLSHDFDFATAVKRIDLPEKHPVKLEGCFVSDIVKSLKSYYSKSRKTHYDTFKQQWDDEALKVKDRAHYILTTLCDLGCKMPELKKLTHAYETTKRYRSMSGSVLHSFGVRFYDVVFEWPRDTNLLRKVRKSGFPVGGKADQALALWYALEEGGASSAKALLDIGLKMPADSWHRLSGGQLSNKEYFEARDFARTQGWDVR